MTVQFAGRFSNIPVGSHAIWRRIQEDFTPRTPYATPPDRRSTPKKQALTAVLSQFNQKYGAWIHIELQKVKEGQFTVVTQPKKPRFQSMLNRVDRELSRSLEAQGLFWDETLLEYAVNKAQKSLTVKALNRVLSWLDATRLPKS